MAWTVLFALVALGWLLAGAALARGMLRRPRLADVGPLPPDDAPPAAILVAGRDEERVVGAALASLLAQDHPRLSVVFVDDRSRDGTGRIADEAAARDPRLSVLHVRELPAGWLGKNHALWRAWHAAERGSPVPPDWLVFTDADVRFAPDVVLRALALARREGWEHLSLLGGLDLVGWREELAVTSFALGFALDRRPWKVADPRSSASLGVGAFQLVSRAAYEAVGTHERLALEVVDDVALGRLVKRAGLRSGVALAPEHVRLRWYEGLGALVRGLEKNAFAYSGFRVPVVAGQVLGLALASLAPFAGVVLLAGAARAAAGAAAVAAVLVHAAVARGSGGRAAIGLLHPLGAALLAWVLVRSTAVTLARGGVTWRGSFHPLGELRRAARRSRRER